MRYSLDQTTDYSKRELYNFLNDIPVPDFVKVAELDDLRSTAILEKEAFADKYNKAFPIYSKPSTYISNVYFINKKAELKKIWGAGYIQEVEDRIKKAADIFGITDAVTEYNQKVAHKETKDYNTDYIFQTKVGAADVNLFSVKTKDEFSKAAEYFAKHASKYPFDWRRTIANNFVKKASQFGVDELPDLVCKYAGMFFPDQAAVEQEIWRRSNKLASEKAKEKLAQLKEEVKSCSCNEDYFKLAQAVYNVEAAEGVNWNEKVAGVLGDVVERFFTVSIEKAAEFLDVVEMGGERFHLNDLQKVSRDIYKEAFGTDMDPMNKVALREVLPTMPLSDVSLFKELSGVSPL